MTDKKTANQTFLDIVKDANSGALLWESVGPLVQHFLEMGKDGDEVITGEDLNAASDALGVDIDDLHEAIEQKEARDFNKPT